MKRYLCLLVLIVSALFWSCDGESSQNKKVEDGTSGRLTTLNDQIAADSSNHALLFERAQIHYESGDFDRAIDDLNRAIELDPEVPVYYHLLSDVYMDYYRSKESLQVMEEAGRKFPKRIQTQLKLSETQFILKQHDASLFTIAKILTVEPQNAEAYFMMGLNFRAIDETEKAINAFQTATELDPEMVDAWLILGKMFEDRGNPLALQYYEAAININPDIPEVWHSKAFYLQNNGRIAEAIDIYKKIHSIDKYYLDAYLNAGILYMELDSFEQARSQFDIMANLASDNYIAYYYRGLANKELGRNEAAIRDLDNALNLKPDFQKAIIARNELEPGES